VLRLFWNEVPYIPAKMLDGALPLRQRTLEADIERHVPINGQPSSPAFGHDAPVCGGGDVVVDLDEVVTQFSLSRDLSGSIGAVFDEDFSIYRDH
jgi:hypothetical protein